MLSTGGFYAPTIRHHQNTVYVVCTNIIHPDDSSPYVSENFIVSTNDIWSDEWSDPVYFDFRGIDPCIFSDTDGRTYMQGSAAPGPMMKIHLCEIDLSLARSYPKRKRSGMELEEFIPKARIYTRSMAGITFSYLKAVHMTAT